MAKTKSSGKTKIIFRKNVNIGAYDAHSDSKFLSDCFVDTGNFDILQDTENPQCLVLGRTGSGKTALLERFGEVERHIKIEPDALSPLCAIMDETTSPSKFNIQLKGGEQGNKACQSQGSSIQRFKQKRNVGVSLRSTNGGSSWKRRSASMAS